MTYRHLRLVVTSANEADTLDQYLAELARVYGEIARRAPAIAWYLRRHGATPEVAVRAVRAVSAVAVAASAVAWAVGSTAPGPAAPTA